MDGQPWKRTQPPSSYAPQRPRRSFPVGLILILILTGFAIIRDLTSSIDPVNPVLVFGTTVITGRIALLWYLVELAVMITLFVMIIKRRELGRILGIGVSAFKILLSSVNFFVYMADPEGVYDMLARAVPTYSPYHFVASLDLTLVGVGLSAVRSWIIGVAVIVYLIVRKSYFTNSSAGSVAPPAGPIQQPLRTGLTETGARGATLRITLFKN